MKFSCLGLLCFFAIHFWVRVQNKHLVDVSEGGWKTQTNMSRIPLPTTPATPTMNLKSILLLSSKKVLSEKLA